MSKTLVIDNGGGIGNRMQNMINGFYFRNKYEFTNNLINNSNDMDSNKIKKSIENTNFETLKKKEKFEGFAEAILDEQGNKKTFFNLGKDNNYKKLLNISTTNKLEKIFNKEMKELNYI